MGVGTGGVWHSGCDGWWYGIVGVVMGGGMT